MGRHNKNTHLATNQKLQKQLIIPQNRQSQSQSLESKL
jgi:hypothetical protein